MKRVLISLLFVVGLINIMVAQSFTKSFDTPNALNEWTGDITSWKIVETSTVAGGATGSKTLKLNAPAGGGEKYLSIKNPVPWKKEQSWKFWIGRDQFSFTASNKCYIWLWADRDNLSDKSINGYRLRIGDNVGDGDNLVLERVENGIAKALTSKENNFITNNIVNYGFGVNILRSSNSVWTIYTSENPLLNGGINANTVISDGVVPFNLYSSDTKIIDSTFTEFEGGFVGISAIYTTDSKARTALEFDQFEFAGSLNHKEYIWIGNDGADFGETTNWSPSRTLKRVTDVLKFDKTCTINQVTNEDIASIKVSSVGNVTFKNPSQTVWYLSGSNQPALEVSQGAQLKISSNNNFIINLNAGGKGVISGTMEFSKESSTPNHRLIVEDAYGLLVNGTVVQNCKGNLFGNSKQQNTVVFEEGAVFIAKDGGNPFALTSPASKIILKKGSIYKHQHNQDFSTAGRVYSRFEFESGGVTLTQGGNLPMITDDFTVINGKININNKDGKIEIKINGDLKIVSDTAVIQFGNNTGISSIELSGENKAIEGGNKISVGKNGSLIISNNITTNDNLLINGTLKIDSGIFNITGTGVRMGDNSVIHKVKGELSKAPISIGQINFIYGDGDGNHLIETGNELLAECGFIKINNTGNVALKSSLNVSNSLELLNGKLLAKEDKFVTLKATSKIKVASTLNFVEGPIAREISSISEILFPIGLGDKSRPLTVIPATSEVSTFKVSYNRHSFQNLGMDPELKGVSKSEFWNIEKTGNIKARIKIGWDAESGVNEENINDLRVARFDGSIWRNEGLVPVENENAIISNELTAFGPITFGSVNNDIFPVTFRSFSGQVQGLRVILQWTTETELNNSGFEVQKSIDGIEFTGIGFVAPLDNQTETKKYLFTDKEFYESSYYRIKQIDHNGQFMYSKIIKITATQFATFKIYPNPATDHIQIEGPGENIEVLVTSLEGYVIEKAVGNLKMINNRFIQKVRQLEAGPYLVVFKFKDRFQVIKLFKE